jgi:hypothetical protein
MAIPIKSGKRLSPEALLRNLAVAALQSSSWDGHTAAKELRARILEDGALQVYVLKFCITEAVQKAVGLAMKAQREKERVVLGRRLTSVERSDAARMLDEQLSQSHMSLQEAKQREVVTEQKWETRIANGHIHRAKWFSAIYHKLPDALTTVGATLSEDDVRTLWVETSPEEAVLNRPRRVA